MSLIRLSTAAPSAWSLTGVGQAPFPVLPLQLDLIVAVLNRDPLELLAIEVDHVPACALRFGRVRLFAFEKFDPDARAPTTRARRRSVVRVFIVCNSLGAPPPPDEQAQDRRHQRHENQNDPAQLAQRLFIEGESERLRNFRRDADESVRG